jgi:hypothetical protein
MRTVSVVPVALFAMTAIASCGESARPSSGSPSGHDGGFGATGPGSANTGHTGTTSTTTSAATGSPAASSSSSGSGAPAGVGGSGGSSALQLVRHETFDAPFEEPAWTEDTYGPESPYHVDPFDEDGEFFRERGGATFEQGLAKFRSFRKSFTYGEAGWLTVELYGRDSDKNGEPETGGHFTSVNGKARLVSTRHYDAAILRSTDALPKRYRVEVTVSNISFGGKKNGSWTSDGKTNGYDGDEVADPWRFTDDDKQPISAVNENGLYFLCITDYARPAPHNNVFIHHHRKVVMDTDNNQYDGTSWSQVWDPLAQRPVEDGSHYVSMIWLNGETFGSEWTGNEFTSYTPGGFQTGPIFADKYLDGEAYVFSVERDEERYTMSVTGKFHYGGQTTYRASRAFRDTPVVWHYNEDAAEYTPPYHDETRSYLGSSYSTWPEGSAYPDHFLMGDPHINFYEGSAEFDDLKLYLPP